MAGCLRGAVARLLRGGGITRLCRGRAVAGLLGGLARLSSGRTVAGCLRGAMARLLRGGALADLLRGLARLSRRRGVADLPRVAGVSHDDFIGQLSTTRGLATSALALTRAVAGVGGLGGLLVVRDLQVGDGPLAVEVSNSSPGNAVEEGQYGQDVVTHCESKIESRPKRLT